MNNNEEVSSRKKRRRFIIKVVFFAVLITLVGSLFMYVSVYILDAFPEREGEQQIKSSFLINELKDGQAFRLNELIKLPGATACVLWPYESLLYFSDHPRKDFINEYLKKVNYRSSQFRWAIVIADDQTVNLSKFRQSKTLYYGTDGEAQLIMQKNGIKKTVCTDLEKAVIVKTRSQNQVHITFGEVE